MKTPDRRWKERRSQSKTKMNARCICSSTMVRFLHLKSSRPPKTRSLSLTKNKWRLHWHDSSERKKHWSNIWSFKAWQLPKVFQRLKNCKASLTRKCFRPTWDKLQTKGSTCHLLEVTLPPNKNWCLLKTSQCQLTESHKTSCPSTSWTNLSPSLKKWASQK